MLSITNLVIGPAVSSVEDIGTIPARLTLPIVGFIPTSEFADDGDKIDPDVSDPNEAAAKFEVVDTPLPELEPPVSKIFLPYGCKVCPPIAL